MSKKDHFPGYRHQTPERDSKGWIRVINRGCGGREFNTPDGRDFDCDHGYAWICEDCPIGIVSGEDSEAKYLASLMVIQGPPSPHNAGDLRYPQVATEVDAYKANPFPV